MVLWEKEDTLVWEWLSTVERAKKGIVREPQGLELWHKSPMPKTGPTGTPIVDTFHPETYEALLRGPSDVSPTDSKEI